MNCCFHQRFASISDLFQVESVENRYGLATISGDGRILLWEVEDNLDFPTRGFSIYVRKKLVGGRTLAFSPFDRSQFVLGSETGNLIRGMIPSVVAGSAQVGWFCSLGLSG